MVSDDPQDVAEALDEDWVDDVDDRTGDRVGDALRGYPPERPLGVEAAGITAVEEDGGESLAERADHEVPDAAGANVAGTVGQLVESSASTDDREEQQIADALPAAALGPEEVAMHVTDEPG